MNKSMRDFGRYLQQVREGANVTQADVAAALGYSTPQFVSNVERGRCLIPVPKIPAWAKKIGIHPKPLLLKQIKTDYCRQSSSMAKFIS